MQWVGIGTHTQYVNRTMFYPRSLKLILLHGISGTDKIIIARITIIPRAGSDGSMSAYGSASPGFDPRRDSKFSTSGLGGDGDVHFLIARFYIIGLD